MTESNNNITSSRGGTTNFLAEIANEIGVALTNNPQLKLLMIKHIEKVIQKAEEYGQYIRTEWQKAKEAGLTQHDASKDEEDWSWWTAYSKDWTWGSGVYFTDDESLDVQFYIKGKPKPDPLSYLYSMVWGSVGENYNGLELLDYQFILLAIIHDAQNWQAGHEIIYFNSLQETTLSDRLCRTVWHHLKNKIDSYNFRDVKNTIKIAQQAIKASVEQETQNMIKLFISHSSKDQELVEKLIELLKNALCLSSSEIRCTSIDGYRLPGGANTNELLKSEVRDTKAFIGLISFAAIDSMYVLFELGARWGSDKHLLPLLAPGVLSDILKGPISGLNALSCGNVSQLHQLINDIAKELGIKPEPPQAYQRYIEAIHSIVPSKDKNLSVGGQAESQSLTCPNCSTTSRPFYMSPIPRDFVEIENATHECSHCKYKTRSVNSR